MKLLKGFISAAAAFVMLLNFPAAASAQQLEEYKEPPQLSAGAVCGDKLRVNITNIDEYSDSTKFEIYVSSNKLKSCTAAQLKENGGSFAFTDNKKRMLKPDTKYTVKAVAEFSDSTKAETSLALKTSKYNFVTVYGGTKLYTLKDGKMKAVKTLKSDTVCRGVMTDKNGGDIAGKSKSDVKCSYIRITLPEKNGKNINNEQLYKYTDYYIKNSSGKTFNRKSTASVRNLVSNNAVKMSRVTDQKYVLCGEEYSSKRLRSDCSGLTKLSMLKAGIYLTHNAYEQSVGEGKAIFNNIVKTGKKGGVVTYKIKDPKKSIDISSLEKGDLLFFVCSTNDQKPDPSYTANGIGHVAMYVGDGKMAHFTSSYGLTDHPCRIEDIEDYQSRSLKIAKAVRVIL